MPNGGDLQTAKTYTLTGNCVQTSALNLLSSGTITIDGKGYSVDASALTRQSSFIKTWQGAKLVLKDLTVIGGGYSGGGSVDMGDDGAITNVTFQKTYRAAVAGSSSSAGTYTLTSILFEDLEGAYFYRMSSPSAVLALNSGAFTLNKVVFRDLVGGSSAMGSPFSANASITITGCMTSTRVYPRLKQGAITDNSTGECNGKIGNTHDAVDATPAPSPVACGLPDGGFISADAAYTLKANCRLSDTLYIPSGVTVTITGGGRTVSAGGSFVGIRNAGTTTINGVVFTGFSNYPIRTDLRGQLTIKNSRFQSNSQPL